MVPSNKVELEFDPVEVGRGGIGGVLFLLIAQGEGLAVASVVIPPAAFLREPPEDYCRDLCADELRHGRSEREVAVLLGSRSVHDLLFDAFALGLDWPLFRLIFIHAILAERLGEELVDVLRVQGRSRESCHRCLVVDVGGFLLFE